MRILSGGILQSITLGALLLTLPGVAHGADSSACFSEPAFLFNETFAPAASLEELHDTLSVAFELAPPPGEVKPSEFYKALKENIAHAGALIHAYDYELRDKAKRYGLTKEEAIAIYAYTGDGFKPINAALRQGGKQLEEVMPVIAALRSGLKKLPPYRKGAVVRGTNLPPEIRSQYQVGRVVSDRAFLSTSADRYEAFPGGDQFVIHTRSCPYIAPFSIHSSEKEVLCPPGTRFRVLERRTVDGLYEYVLKEHCPTASELLKKQENLFNRYLSGAEPIPEDPSKNPLSALHAEMKVSGDCGGGEQDRALADRVGALVHFTSVKRNFAATYAPSILSAGAELGQAPSKLESALKSIRADLDVQRTQLEEAARSSPQHYVMNQIEKIREETGYKALKKELESLEKRGGEGTPRHREIKVRMRQLDQELTPRVHELGRLASNLDGALAEVNRKQEQLRRSGVLIETARKVRGVAETLTPDSLVTKSRKEITVITRSLDSLLEHPVLSGLPDLRKELARTRELRDRLRSHLEELKPECVGSKTWQEYDPDRKPQPTC